MAAAQRRRRRQWRAAGKRKSERTFRWIAVVLAGLVIAATLFFGYVRKHEAPAGPAINVTSSAADEGGP